MNLLLPIALLSLSYSGSFDCNSGELPWGHHFNYEYASVQVEPDYKFFVTVIYSTQEKYKSQYLKQWMHMHPALKDLQAKTNFREIDESNPIYNSYLRSKLPQLPAIVVTLPADDSYRGKAIYVAYGRYLPSNPNTLAAELQVTFSKYTAAYKTAQKRMEAYKAVSYQKKEQGYRQYQQCRPGQPCFPRPPQYQPVVPPNINVELPVVRPRLREVEREDDNTKILLLIFGAIVIFFMVQKRR